jgi:DNA-binding MarR family transcriptional regulator
LERAGLLLKTDERIELKSLDGETTISIPKRVDYSCLSMAAIKVLIACYQKVQHKRVNVFKCVASKRELAKAARIGESQVVSALRQLEKAHLLRRVLHNERLKALASKGQNPHKFGRGTLIILMDPGSETDLCEWRFMAQSPMLLYQWSLEGHDPGGAVSRAASLENYVANCPLCGGRKTFQFTCTKDAHDGPGEDCWYCYKCKESGNSQRLVHMTGSRQYRDWKRELPGQNKLPPNWNVETESESEMYE